MSFLYVKTPLVSKWGTNLHVKVFVYFTFKTVEWIHNKQTFKNYNLPSLYYYFRLPLQFKILLFLLVWNNTQKKKYRKLQYEVLRISEYLLEFSCNRCTGKFPRPLKYAFFLCSWQKWLKREREKRMIADGAISLFFEVFVLLRSRSYIWSKTHANCEKQVFRESQRLTHVAKIWR